MVLLGSIKSTLLSLSVLILLLLLRCIWCFYIAGLITTTQRKLDREAQEEHILEVNVLFVCWMVVKMQPTKMIFGVILYNDIKVVLTHRQQTVDVKVFTERCVVIVHCAL